MDSGIGFMSHDVKTIPLNCTLKSGYNGKILLCMLYHNLKNNNYLIMLFNTFVVSFSIESWLQEPGQP